VDSDQVLSQMSFWPKEFAANLKGKKKSKKSF
jgi:hypothetical protein